ncbi:MAG: hypothetical protein AB2L20_29370 [Mangrovibacterium sp.]
MKRKFKLLLLLFLALPVMLPAEEYDKKVHRDFPKSQITALSMINKFGSVEIRDTGGDVVTVDAKVTVKDVSESKARQLLDLIMINIGTNGGLLEVETIIKDDFRSKGNFTIDYKINIPKDRDLTVNNKYGNLVLTDLEGHGHFTIAYGNMTAGNINPKDNSPVWLDLSYGKADLGSVTNLKGLIKYSKVFAGTGGKMELETKYSGLDVKKMNDLQLESKYDGIRIGEISTISANSKYTNYTVERLSRQLILDSEYGSVRIDEVTPDFSAINITNSYGGVTIGLNGLDYRLDAECEYCDVKYPGERFKGNRIKENQNLRINGTVGSVASGKNIVIRSRYGGINLIK